MPRTRSSALRRPIAPKVAQAENATLIWSGPDQFLVLSPRDGNPSMDMLRQAFSGLAVAVRPVARARTHSRRRTACARHAGQAVVDRPASGGIPSRQRGGDLDRPHQRQPVARAAICRTDRRCSTCWSLRHSRKACGTPCSTPRPNTGVDVRHSGRNGLPRLRFRHALDLLFFAGIFEIGWAIGLKYTNGFTRLVPTALTWPA